MTPISIVTQAMGLALAAHFKRLMPLLLGWTRARDVDTVVGALRALHAVLQCTWPRMPAHAMLIWINVAAAHASAVDRALRPSDTLPAGCTHGSGYDGSDNVDGKAGGRDSAAENLGRGMHVPETNSSSGRGSEEGGMDMADVVRWAERVSELLWWCGGEGFREAMRRGEDGKATLTGALRDWTLSLSPEGCAHAPELRRSADSKASCKAPEGTINDVDSGV